MLGRKKQPQQVTSGRFELERDGQVAYLEYTLGAGVLTLQHTEVPQALRGHGMSSKLAEGAFQYARDNNLRVDIVCPSVLTYLAEHPEYNDLVMK
jgi:uncharacterized protein